MPVVGMKYLKCIHCQRETRHRTSTLEQVFQRLPVSATVSQQIPYACPACNHLGVADVPIVSKLFDFLDRKRHPDDAVEFLVHLECEQDNCESRIIVFAPMERGTGDDQAKLRMKQWIRSDLKCQQGHPLRHPYFLLGMHLL